jgi:hypothetical protein
MNYFGPRQRESTKRWDYTCRNDNRIWPVGYCAGWRDYTAEERRQCMMNDVWYANYESRRASYHTDGHATSDEACECYKQYQLDDGLRFGEDSSSQKKCQVCEAWTTKRAMVGGYRSFVLCEAHATREEVEKLFTVGESWES